MSAAHAAESRALAFADAEHLHTHAYLWPVVRGEIVRRRPERAFDLGCGNGSFAEHLIGAGWRVTGIDPSPEGVAFARQRWGVDAHVATAYDDLAARFGRFPLVISLEVVEHLIDPRAWARTFMALIAPGGTGIASTPYHGYLKHVALAVSGKMDAHLNPLWDGGHVKFFSIPTFRRLLDEAGARDIRFARVGRCVPALAKSMVAVVRAP